VLLSFRPGAGTARIWQWYCTSFMPTLGLIAGVLSTAVRRGTESTEERQIDRLYYYLTMSVSVGYVLSALFVILYWPSLYEENLKLSALLDTSNYWLGPAQGIVAALISGVFFHGNGMREE
jgi:hypothetical protein